MISILVASNKAYSGKTLVCLGLALRLKDEGYKAGYVKPIGSSLLRRGSAMVDADAIFMKEALALKEPDNVVSPFVMSFEAGNKLFEGGLKDVKKAVSGAIKSVKGKDFLIIEGGGDLSEGALLGLDAMSLASMNKARTLFIEPWGNSSADSAFSSRNMFGEGFLGCLINKVPSQAMGHAGGRVRPYLEKRGVKVFGVIEKDSVLASVTVGELNELLGGKVVCAEDKLGERVENFSIGAMDVDSALRYFRKTPNKAVITGAYRADIQLAALETSTKCIILTGGMHTNDVVIGRAQALGVPIISVPGDTYGTIDKIESAVGKTGISGENKIRRARELMEKGFDLGGFLKALGV